eukprot:15002419-Heterocapsa_arctica.AAC.1
MSSSLKTGSSSTSTTSSAVGVDVADLSDGVGVGDLSEGVGVVADLRGDVGPSSRGSGAGQGH